MRVRQFLLWWIALLALWLMLVSQTTVPYLVVGIAASALAAGSAMLAAVSQERFYSFDVRWLRWFVLAIPATVGDTLRLARLLLRPVAEQGGSLRALRLPAEDERRAAGRRATAVLALGLAPGSYVVDIEGDRLLLHELPGGGDRLVRSVLR